MMNKKRGLAWGIAVVALIALGCWMRSRWDVWFKNTVEKAYTVDTTPHRLLLTFGDENELSRNISWQADTVIKPSWLELATDSDTLQIKAYGEVFRSRSGQGAFYVARLRQLQAGKKYAYRAISGGKASAWYHFSTQTADKDQVTFLYVGDVQDTIGGQANRFLRKALKHQPRTEFLVCGGDLTERPTDEYWGETFRDIDSICQTMPLITVTGNHDYLKGVFMKLERRFSLVFSYFLDSMVDENQVYTVNYGPIQFFLLDSNRELPYLLTQREWLRNQLEQSNARWKIVVLHHPLFSIKGKLNNSIQRWCFNDLIEEYGVDLVLQGHEHAYARMTHDGKTPIYTISHCSPKNYRIHFSDKFDKYGISSRYYQVVNIHADTLTLSAYEVYNNTLYDSLRIVKEGTNTRITDFGRQIPEYLEFTPDASNKKDRAYAERIEEYKKQHPERLKGHRP